MIIRDATDGSGDSRSYAEMERSIMSNCTDNLQLQSYFSLDSSHRHDHHCGQSRYQPGDTADERHETTPDPLALYPYECPRIGLFGIPTFASRSIRQHPHDPLALLVPRSPHQVIREQGEEGGGSCEDEGNEHEWCVSRPERLGEQDEEEDGDMKDKGEKGGEEEEKGGVGELRYLIGTAAKEVPAYENNAA